MVICVFRGGEKEWFYYVFKRRGEFLLIVLMFIIVFESLF